MKAIARREFLVLAAGTAAALLASCGTVPNASVLQSQDAEKPQAPAALPEVRDGLHLTPVGDFYVQSYGSTPGKADLNSYRFVLDGLVENSLAFTYAELTALPAVEIMRTMECIGNPVGGSLIGNQMWKGVRLGDLLEQAKIKPTARRARFYALDQYSNSLDLERIRQPNTLLVYEMAGQPLPLDHGYPLRIFIPGHYGQKQPKWLHRIELIDSEYKGYWENQGWSDTAIIQINSIVGPLPDKTAVGTAVRVSGVAMSREVGVKSVEVGLKGPDMADVEWHPAQLTRPPTPMAWTEWSYDWTPAKAGGWSIYARASDNSGEMQTDMNGSLLGGFPSGASAIHHRYTQASA